MCSQKVSLPDRYDSGDPIVADLFADGLVGDFVGKMNEVFGRLIGPNDLWDFVLDLAFHEDARIASRGTWALEWAYYNNKAAFRPHAGHFVVNYLRVTNPSAHRHYTKMLCDMQRCGLLVLDDAQADRVAEKTFDLLINPATKVAVKVWCMEILFDLSPRLDWVDEQLRETVEQVMHGEPSRGVANRAAKLLRRIDAKSKGKGAGDIL